MQQREKPSSIPPKEPPRSLDEYILSHIDAEGEYLHALWRDTQLRLSYGQMASGHLQGRLLKMLIQMMSLSSLSLRSMTWLWKVNVRYS